VPSLKEFPVPAVPDLDAAASYAYELPADLIAQAPAVPRDSARLLVVGGFDLASRVFRDLPDHFSPGDVLVMNETRVVRARVFGAREPGGGRSELFFLRPAGGVRFDASATDWLVLARPGKRVKPGTRVRFDENAFAEITADGPDGTRVARIGGTTIEALFAKHGEVPLPPYVTAPPPGAESAYQTVFARVPGSVAAPTASLHFTEAVLAALRRRGVEIVRLVLDVGLGTFRPIKTERLDDHAMHAEAYEIPGETAAAIAAARARGARITAAGTTALRALEAAAEEYGVVRPGAGETELFVRPGYRFRVVDRLLTNFHLPGSTLLVLVAAFAGYEEAMHAYRVAIEARYRFFSFGDAMLVDRRGANAGRAA
jgi:S-adenosylmethionine:tRNA ribosyltransferase-isomerase